MQSCTVDERKPYEPPAMRSRELNQAIRLLEGHAYLEDAGARVLLALLFSGRSDTEALPS